MEKVTVSFRILHHFNQRTALLILWLFVAGLAAIQAVSYKKTGDIVVTTDALTINGRFGDIIHGASFQQEALISFGEYQYTAFYDSQRNVCLVRRSIRNNRIDSFALPNYRFKGGKDGNDGHNTISLGICPLDGTLHIAFDHHNDTLHYVRSLNGVIASGSKKEWNASLFHPMNSHIDGKPATGICYPRFFNHSSGELQLAYRVGGSGNGDAYMADYNSKNGEWQNLRRIDSRKGVFTDSFSSSNSRNLYRNGFNYDSRGWLHCTGMWRERSGGMNHGFIYLYSKDKGYTWLNNRGETVGDPANGVNVTFDSPGISVAPIGRDRSLINQQGQAVDRKNRPHVVVWHRKDSAGFNSGKWLDPQNSSYFHYWRDDKGNWSRNEIPSPVGTRPKICMDRNNNAYALFTVKENSDKRDKGFHFVKGTLIVARATAATGWKDWQIVVQEKGPFLSEPLLDPVRWEKNAVLSVVMQETPTASHKPAPIRILEYNFESSKR